MVTGDETGLASQLISTPPLPTQPMKGCTTPPGSVTPTLYEQQCGYFSRTFLRKRNLFHSSNRLKLIYPE